ncbi:MAG: 2-hydroxyacid dehydrogenase [Anaerolineae bacterium]
MFLRVHLLHPPDDDSLAILRQALSETVALSTGDDIPPEAQVLVAGRPSAEQIAACPALQAVIIPFAGLPAATRELLRQHPRISVHNLHHNAVPTAEMALALLLAAAKRLVPADRALRSGDWTPRYRPIPAIHLNGKTALILGYGAVGRHIARLCKGIGMRAIAIRRTRPSASAPTTEPAEAVYAISALHDLLPRADALLIALPLTDVTRGLLGAQELGLLPPHAVLVNVGRAEIIEESALFDALQSGRIHGAGLDVWYRYPSSPETRSATAPSNLPFHTLDNVVMSPHRAGGGGTPETERLRMLALADLLNQAANGKLLANRVDLARGY